jgi:excisionase family DNA binding protein
MLIGRVSPSVKYTKRYAERGEAVPRYPEKDQAPDGYITPQTAAEVLGVSDMTVRNHLKERKLEGMTVLTEGGELRYYASRAAVAATLATRSEYDQERSREIVALEMEEITLRHMRNLETILNDAVEERKVIQDNQEAIINAATELAQGSTRQSEILLKILKTDRARRLTLYVVAAGVLVLVLLLGIVALGVFDIFLALER